MNRSFTIFVDSDAFIALIKKDDTNHRKAKAIFQKVQSLPFNFVTSNYVFSEVVTILSQKIDHKTAVKFIHNMRAEDNMFVIERIKSETEEEAVQVFIEQTSKNVSFVDCANMAFIREKRLDGIFSFDDDYKKNGIQLIENLL